MAGTVVEVVNLRFRYLGSRRYVLNGLDFRMLGGELVIITGPTGSGKTTLCRVLTGLIPKLYPGELSGHVKVTEVDPVSAVRARKVMYVGPNPEEQFLFPTVTEELGSYGLKDGVVEEVLAALGLKALKNSVVFELSMGEKQRVTLAAALARAPDLLILDEALTFIDEPFLTRALDYVYGLVKHGSAVLVVTKAPHVITRFAELGAKLVLIEEGAVKVAGNAKSILKSGASDASLFLGGLLRMIMLRHGVVREVMACRAS